MEVRINLNEKVKFKLSEHGKEIYRHRYDGYGFEYDREPKLDDDGYMTMQLWMFMQIFGKHMTLGMPEVVKPLEIIYKQEDESDTISRQAVEEMIKAEMPERGMWEIEGDKVKETVCEVCVDLMQKLSELPPTESERPKGEWIETRQHHLGKHADITVIDEAETYACDCISRQAAMSAIYNIGAYMGRKDAMDTLKALPSVDRPTGRWYDVGVSARCDQCGCKNIKPTRYCPNCGARMIGDNDEGQR